MEDEGEKYPSDWMETLRMLRDPQRDLTFDP